jgi:hypothetical protein
MIRERAYELYESRGRAPAKTNRTGSAPSRRSSNTSGKGPHPPPPVDLLECWRVAMDCLICKDLERALESRRGKYIEARSTAYYRVSTELAAKENVDMERAKSDWDEHRSVCFGCHL